MSNQPKYWSKAIKYLSKDKIMRKLILKYKDKTLTSRRDIFLSLCKSIIGQQISVAAANSVFLNFKKTELAAATLICCPIILLHNDKKIFFLVVKVLSLYLSISFFITLSFERYFVAFDQYFGCLLTFKN